MKWETLAVAVLGLAALTIACGGNGGSSSSLSGTPDAASAAAECSKSAAKELTEQVEPLIDRFDDANERAGSTSRISLSPVIGEMQEVRRDFKDLEVDSCAEQAKEVMVDYMDKTIDAYIAFLADESDSTVRQLIEDAGDVQVEAVVAWGVIFSKADE